MTQGDSPAAIAFALLVGIILLFCIVEWIIGRQPLRSAAAWTGWIILCGIGFLIIRSALLALGPLGWIILGVLIANSDKDEK